MDPINPLDGITELLRKRIAAEVSAKDGIRSKNKSSETQHGQASQRLTPEALRHKITTLVKAINPDDPKRQQKILRVFVESVLVWQFGEELVNDPKFSTLVNEIGDTLEKEPNFIQQLTETT